MLQRIIMAALLVAAFLSNPVDLVFAAENKATTPSQQQLEKLVEPIALYPDVLLQQVLAAATFPDQVVDAAIYLEQGKDPKQIVNQTWDLSVKTIADYPSIVAKMASDIDWTIALGDAYINNNKELRAAIQTLRARAKAAGNLKTSDKQEVTVDSAPDGKQVIVIEPTQPEIIYVPTTTTSTVYQQPVSSTNYLQPLATFGVGMLLGSALADDDDEHNYYYGGHGPGYWYHDDEWIDYRKDRLDDINDYYRDRQDFRQEQFDKAADYHREHYDDLKKKQGEYLNQAKNRAGEMSPEQRAQAQSKAQEGKNKWQSASPEERKEGAQTFAQDKSFDRSAAQQRLESARSNTELQSRAQTARTNQESIGSARGSGAGLYTSTAGRSNAAPSSSFQRPSYERGGALSMNGGASYTRLASSRGTSSLQRAGGGARVSRGGGGRRR